MSNAVQFLAHPGMTSSVAASEPARSEASATSNIAWWQRHFAMLAVLALTVVGGALRFYALDRPPLWGDEAATYARICATYRDLLDVLRDAAFPPLHYQLYWWLSRHMPMDPFGLRLVPAIAGTLMIPAMYFLARQMVGVRAALVATTLTAGSAYMLAYSRDAKMYVEFWLAVTLSTASLLWWTRTGRSTAWLCWLACGVAMVGLHGMGFAMLAVHLLMYLTGRRAGALTAVAFVVGLMVICAGDAVHYGLFNVVGDRMEQRGWGALGIDWADARNAGQPTRLIVTDALGAFLFSFLWIQERPYGVVIARVATAMAWALGVTLALLALGAMPWPRRWTAYGAPGRLVEPLPGPEPAWRVTAWLAVWVVLPAYAMYCASTVNPASPIDWITAIGSLADGRWWVLGLTLIAGCALTQAIPFMGSALGVAIGLALVYTLVEAFVHPVTGAESLPWELRWGARLGQPLVLGTLLAAVVAVWFDAAGRTTSERLAAAVKGALVAIGVLVLCGVVYTAVQHYFEKRTYVFDRAGADPADDRRSVWMPRWLAVVWPAVALGVAVLFANLPTRPLRWGVIVLFVGVNLAQFVARVNADTEAPLALLASDAVAGRTDGNHRDNPVRVYFQTNRTGASPGWASIESTSGSYYLVRAMNRPKTSPWDVRRNVALRELRPRAYPGSDARVADEARADGKATRVVVWTQHDPAIALPDDELADLLGPGWLAAGDRVFKVRSFWNWSESYQYRRREYVKAAG
jgi:hypothetical protein